MSGTRAGSMKRLRSKLDNRRYWYLRELRHPATARAHWAAYNAPLAADFPEWQYLDDPPFEFKPGLSAVSVTHSPKGDPFGLAAIDYACETRPKLFDVEQFKKKARKSVQHAIARGNIARQPCETCGTPIAEAHHDDYSRPLEVRWLCRLHHDEEHHGQVAA